MEGNGDLRGRLLTAADAGAIKARGTESAVLLPLYGWPEAPGLIFTERRADLRRHAGEVSFPGGRADPGDADLAATALREAHEEIALDPPRSSWPEHCRRSPPSSPATGSSPSSASSPSPPSSICDPIRPRSRPCSPSASRSCASPMRCAA